MNIGTIVTIATYVIFFAVFLAYFFAGFRRGVKRSAIHFACSLVLVILAYIFTPMISKAILKINISSGGSSVSLSQYVIDLISSGSLQSYIENSTAIQSLVNALPLIVLNIAVFILLYIIVRLLGFIIYKIIEKCTLKSKKQEKELGLKRNRWVGAGMGVVEGLIFFILLIAPINSLIGLVGDLEKNYGYTSEEYYTAAKETAEDSIESSSLPSIAEILDYIPSAVKDGISSYNNGPMGVVCGMFGVDNLIFDGLCKTEIDNEPIVLRRDLVNFIDAYNDVYHIVEIINTKNGALKDLQWDEIDQTMNKIFDGGLIKGFATNLMADFIINYSEFGIDLGDYENIVIAMKNVLEDEENAIEIKDYFLHDIKSIYSLASTAGRSGIVDEFINSSSGTMEKVGNVFTTEQKPNLEKVVNTVFDLNILHDASQPVFDLIVDMLKDDTHFINTNTNVSNWTTLSTNINEAIGDVIKVNETINITEIVDEPLKILGLKTNKIDTAFDSLGNALDKLNDLGILVSEGNKTFLAEILNKFGYSDFLYKTESPEAISKPFESYTKLCKYIADPIKEICNLNLYAEMKSDKNKFVIVTTKLSELTDENDGEYPDTLKNIVMKLYELDIFRNMLIPMLKDSVSTFIDLNKLEIEDDFNASYANWENDCEMLTRLLVQLHNIKITKDETTISLDNELLSENADFSELMKKIDNYENLGNLVESLLYTKSATPISDKLFKTIEDAVNNIFADEINIDPSAITFDENSAENQAEEVADVFVNLINIIKNGDINDIDAIEKVKLGELLDSLKHNAYRVQLSSKSEAGIFQSTFDAFYNKLTENETINKILNGKQPYDINYTDLMKAVDSMESEENFASQLKDLIVDGNIETNDIDDLFATINNASTETVEQLVEIINDLDYTVEIEDNDIKDQIKDQINNKLDDKIISEDLANKLRTMFGITE